MKLWDYQRQKGKVNASLNTVKFTLYVENMSTSVTLLILAASASWVNLKKKKSVTLLGILGTIYNSI